jgi:hypothetical protein
MTSQPDRNTVPDRARRRAIRAYAVDAGVPYSVAARRLDQLAPRGAETLASRGRTIYPASSDSHRHQLIRARERWAFADRVRDTRRAAHLPLGRAEHLAERFPPTRGEPGTGVGPLYHGAGRRETLALLYAVVAHEAPGLVPSTGELAWEAELGEDTAVDLACAELDRAVRLWLEADRAALLPRIEAALDAGAPALLAAHYAASMTVPDGPDPVIPGLPVDGARHILDAVLMVADDGHAPGTRVRLLAEPYRGRHGTIVAAEWGAVGPPQGYRVHPDGGPAGVLAAPPDLVVLNRGGADD